MQKLPGVGGEGIPFKYLYSDNKKHVLWTACLNVPTGMELGLNTFLDIRGAIFVFAPGAVLPRYATAGVTIPHPAYCSRGVHVL